MNYVSYFVPRKYYNAPAICYFRNNISFVLTANHVILIFKKKHYITVNYIIFSILEIIFRVCVFSSEKSSEKVTASRGDDDMDDDVLDDDSDIWDSDSESSSSESDAGGTVLMREKFLKKLPTKEEEEKKRRKKEEKAERKKEKKEGDEAWTEVKKGPSMPSERPKMFGKDDEISIEKVVAKLGDILSSRGRRGTDRKEQIEMVHELMGIAKEHKLGEYKKVMQVD